MSDRKRIKTSPSEVKVGDIMAFTYYCRVEQVKSNGTNLVVSCLDSNMEKITIDGRDLVENSASADYFEESEKVSKTKAAEILVSSYGKPFTVCFEKIDGSERVLRGRLVAPEPLLGRSKVEDLESKTGDRMRQVDHRTIRYLVVDGVKYVVQ